MPGPAWADEAWRAVYGSCFRIPGITTARLASRVSGVPRAPGAPSLVAGTAWRWSGRVRQGGDPVPGGHDVGGPGPAGLDPQAASAAAAGQAGGRVQDAVAQGLRLGLGQAAVQGEQAEPGQQGRGGQG